MPTPKNSDLHGSAPDSSDRALLIIDMLNPMEFDEADQLMPHALKAAGRIAELKRAAKARKIPVVYVNDNFGRWRSNLEEIVEHCVRENSRGKELAEKLLPEDDDYFVLKPKHSGFFSTSLDILLEHLGAERLILTGVAGNICVLFTANDAYIRDYKIAVPSDCMASNTKEDNEFALEQMKKILKTDTRESKELIRDL